MSEYKTFKPTEEMLEEFKRRLIYRDVNDLEKDIHKQKMLIMFMNHKMIPTDRTDFHKFYNEYYFELGYYARLVFSREELWFKGQIEHYLETKEPSYGVDLPANDFMYSDMDEKIETTMLIARLFETMLIQQLRGPLDYEAQHEAWYDRYNELNDYLNWFDEEMTKISHAVLARDFEKYLYELFEEDICQCDAKERDNTEDVTTEDENIESENVGYNIIGYDKSYDTVDLSEDTNEDLSEDTNEDTNEGSDK